jgi:orotidine-5'-phosphate decarboxylase
MTFIKKLETRMDKASSLLCVGLDPDLEKIPSHFLTNKDPIFEFNKWIISQTHEHVCAYKPNSAYYESYGSKGIESLKKTCDYIYENHPDIPVIIDAKRGDIGHTNAKYAEFVFDYLGADAVTLQPYCGSESLKEFFKYKDKGLILLCRTSNKGAGEFQDLLVGTNNQPLWQKIAVEVSGSWTQKSQADLLLVIGATYPQELKKARELCPNTTFLVPGVGVQGGSLENTLLFGCNENKKGVIINSSRGIIYSDDPKQAISDLWQRYQIYTQ